MYSVDPIEPRTLLMLLYNQFVYALGGRSASCFFSLGKRNKAANDRSGQLERWSSNSTQCLYFFWKIDKPHHWEDGEVIPVQHPVLYTASQASSFWKPSKTLQFSCHVQKVCCRFFTLYKCHAVDEVILVKEGQNHQFVYVRHGFWPSWALAYLSWALAYWSFGCQIQRANFFTSSDDCKGF